MTLQSTQYIQVLESNTAQSHSCLNYEFTGKELDMSFTGKPNNTQSQNTGQ